MAIATTSERYELVRRVRIASVFQSYEAMHPRRPGRFMLDVFTGMDTNAERPRAFLRDAARVSSLRHPHILQMLELSTMPDGTPIVVSELPPGRTLDAWLDAGHVPSVRTAIKWIAALAEAVDAAHDAGVVHGAIRADNVFLVEGAIGGLGLPKLKGFGLEWLRSPASADPSIGAAMDIAGTVDRAAMDIAGTLGRAAMDIAALGRLAEHLLRLSQPAAMAMGPQEGLGLPGFVALALERASGEGGAPPYESAAELARDLEAAALGPPSDPDLPHGARWSSTGPRRRVPGRGRSALFTIGVAAVVVVCGVGTSSMLEGRHSLASSVRPTREARTGSTTSSAARFVQSPAPGGAVGSTIGAPKEPRLVAAVAPSMQPAQTAWVFPVHAPAPIPSAADSPSASGQPQRTHGRRGIVWSPGLGRLAEVGEITTAFANDGAGAFPAALATGSLVP